MKHWVSAEVRLKERLKKKKKNLDNFVVCRNHGYSDVSVCFTSFVSSFLRTVDEWFLASLGSMRWTISPECQRQL